VAFEIINSNEIEVGDPIKKELFTKIKNSLDYLDTSVTSLANGAARINVFDFTYQGAVSASTLTGLAYYEATQAFTITGMVLRIFEVGSLAGDFQVDVKKNSSFDSVGMTSIFTTLPLIDHDTASDYDESTNQVFNGTYTSVAAGDILRFDVTAIPTGAAFSKFRFTLYGEVT